MAITSQQQTPSRNEFLQKRLQKTWENLSKIKYKIAVMSGKGGVGKTTVAVNLSWLFAQTFRTGLLDADIDCPNCQKFLGLSEHLSMRGETLLPAQKDNLKFVSMGLLQESPDTAIMWRGPLIANTLAQILENTDWGELDYLFFDSPPGTSDVALSLMQSVGLTGVIVVSTPQSVSLTDAKKTLNMARQFGVRVLGLVENMSGEVFGTGSVEKLAREQGVPFLGRIMLDKKIAANTEKSLLPTKEDKGAKKAFEEIAEKLKQELSRK